MYFIHPSFWYIHIQTIAKIVYLQCIKHFSIKRFAFTILFLLLFTFISLLNIFLRLCDEIFFPAYRKINPKAPIFIISNPRSGTTHLHRLMCLDADRYAYTKLFHTILPSITFAKFVSLLYKIDIRIGNPLLRLITTADDVFFKGWENIHPMGFNKSEEDEGTYVFTGITAGIFLLCPYMNDIPEVRFPDNMHPKVRYALQQFYKNAIQRWMYVMGSDKIFLSKNVMSTGRLQTILDAFPDAKIIYIVRKPDESIPSFISMFSLAWKSHSPEIPEDSPQHRAWGELGMDYYIYFHEQMKSYDKKQFYTLKYDDLVSQPKEEVLKIYDYFGIAKTEKFLIALDNATQKARSYKSTHNYTLEQYGMTKADVIEKVGFVYDIYGFDKN
jgi:hypothetical protein